MSDITRRNDIAADMLDRLPAQFKGKPRIEALIRTLANQIQKQEQTFFDLYWRRLLDNAEDQDLDNIGAIVGEARQGWGDDEYRAFVRARIRTNKGDGRLATLLAILTLLDGENTYRVREYYPAAMVVEASEQFSINGEYVNRGFLQRATPAGVSLHFAAPTTTRANSFIFDDEIVPFVDGETQGFSDDAGPSTSGLLLSEYGR